MWSLRGHWVAIDPDPWVGPVAFDCSTVISNRLDVLPAGPGFAPAARGRVGAFARASGTDPEQCRELAVARLACGMLSGHDKGDHARAAQLAALLSALS